MKARHPARRDDEGMCAHVPSKTNGAAAFTVTWDEPVHGTDACTVSERAVPAQRETGHASSACKK